MDGTLIKKRKDFSFIFSSSTNDHYKLFVILISMLAEVETTKTQKRKHNMIEVETRE